mmetsp:Transcript_30944/g.28132  ORF Transcript_30944/g.28132 Transcript_30944/m.28132 type:complete len:189 (+) Transcript_30944:56-622(+)
MDNQAKQQKARDNLRKRFNIPKIEPNIIKRDSEKMLVEDHGIILGRVFACGGNGDIYHAVYDPSKCNNKYGEDQKLLVVKKMKNDEWKRKRLEIENKVLTDPCFKNDQNVLRVVKPELIESEAKESVFQIFEYYGGKKAKDYDFGLSSFNFKIPLYEPATTLEQLVRSEAERKLEKYKEKPKYAYPIL